MVAGQRARVQGPLKPSFEAAQGHRGRSACLPTGWRQANGRPMQAVDGRDPQERDRFIPCRSGDGRVLRQPSVHTGSGFSANAAATIASQQSPCAVVDLDRLLASDVLWPAGIDALATGATLPPREPEDHAADDFSQPRGSSNRSHRIGRQACSGLALGRSLLETGSGAASHLRFLADPGRRGCCQICCHENIPQRSPQRRKPCICRAFAMRRRGLEPPPGYPGPGPQPGNPGARCVRAVAQSPIRHRGMRDLDASDRVDVAEDVARPTSQGPGSWPGRHAPTARTRWTSVRSPASGHSEQP
jgi:hypothetical protein